MKNILMLIFLFACHFIVGQSYWEYSETWNDSLSIMVFAEESLDGNLLTLTHKVDFETRSKYSAKSNIRLLDIDDGATLNSAFYSIDSLIIDLRWIYTLADEKKYIIVGGAHYENDSLQRGYFLKTIWDEELKLIEEELFPIIEGQNNHHIWQHNGTINEEGNLIYLGSCNFDGVGSNNIIIEMNRKGKIINTKYIDNNYSLHFPNAIVETIDESGYLTTGTRNLLINKNLDIIDTIYIDFQIRKVQSIIKKHVDPFYFCSGTFEDGFNPGIFKIDTNYSIINSYDFGLTDQVFESTIISNGIDWKDPENIYTGAYVSPTTHYFSVANFDADLSPKWTKYFRRDDEYSYLPYSLLATTDGGCVIVGIKGELTQTVFPRFGTAWAIKIDSEGNITNAESPIENGFWSTTVYPNPSDGVFRIKIERNEKETVLRLMDLQGRQLATYDQLHEGVNYIDFSKFPNGAYVWQLMHRGEMIGSGKWVKE